MSMSEIDPQFTFSPAGLLRFERGQPEIISEDEGRQKDPVIDQPLEDERDRSQDTLEELPGVIIADKGSTKQYTVAVEEVLGDEVEGGRIRRIEELVQAVNVLVPQLRSTGAEQVLSVRDLSDVQLSIAVHAQFQRWLNHNGITERNVALNCLKAMAVPYDAQDRVDKDFFFREGENYAFAEAAGFRVNSRHDYFNFTKYFEEDGKAYQVAGTDEWEWIGLDVRGGGSIGVDGTTRLDIVVPKNSSRIYKMNSRNVDYARQSLGLLLGMGSLAYQAASYQGREDVFEDVDWDEPQAWPYPIRRAA